MPARHARQDVLGICQVLVDNDGPVGRDEYGGLVASDTDTRVVNDAALACQALGDHDREFAEEGNFLNRRISAQEDLVTSDVGRQGSVDPLPCFERAFSEVVAEFCTAGEEVREMTTNLFGALNQIFGHPFALPPNVPSPSNVRIRRRYRRLRAAGPASRGRCVRPQDLHTLGEPFPRRLS